MRTLLGRLDSGPSVEINPSNYSHDDVCNLNNGYVEYALGVREALPDMKEGKHVHVAVLDGTPKKEAVESLRKHAVEGEGIEVVNGVAYLHTPFGLGTSKLGEKFDKRIGVPNTARNWNTVLKLHEMAKKVAG